MKIRKVHCLFEQSGTFKNEFKKLGVAAEDYDIQNDFGETDHVVDLYHEIETAFDGGASIFDDMTKDDLIMSFFPCVRFENQVILYFRGDNYAQKDWTIKQKMEYDIKLMNELSHNYKMVNMLFLVCEEKGLRLIMENPWSEQHFLVRYWCYPAKVIDLDRRLRGDYFQKPTQYWFFNCEPENNFIIEPMNYNAVECKDAIGQINSTHYEKMGAKNARVARSMIHHDYASRFIREFILDSDLQGAM